MTRREGGRGEKTRRKGTKSKRTSRSMGGGGEEEEEEDQSSRGRKRTPKRHFRGGLRSFKHGTFLSESSIFGGTNSRRIGTLSIIASFDISSAVCVEYWSLFVLASRGVLYFRAVCFTKFEDGCDVDDCRVQFSHQQRLDAGFQARFP